MKELRRPDIFPDTGWCRRRSCRIRIHDYSSFFAPSGPLAHLSRHRDVVTNRVRVLEFSGNVPGGWDQNTDRPNGQTDPRNIAPHLLYADVDDADLGRCVFREATPEEDNSPPFLQFQFFDLTGSDEGRRYVCQRFHPYKGMTTCHTNAK